MNKIYPTDLTDSQWNHIKDFFPLPKETGRPADDLIKVEKKISIDNLCFQTASHKKLYENRSLKPILHFKRIYKRKVKNVFRYLFVDSGFCKISANAMK